MKKRCLTAVGIGMLAAAVLTGCGNIGSGKASNDNITISKYKNLEVEKVTAEKATDEDVKNELQNTLYANQIVNEITDRPVAQGDTVTIDFVGKMDGEEFEGGSAQGTSLTIGSDSFIDGFEDGLVGHNIGETLDLNLTFPDPYERDPEKSGKPVVFTVTIQSITTYTLPELNDTFVQSVSEKSSTVEEYKKELEELLNSQNEENAQISLQNEVWNQVLGNTEVTKYPQEDVDKEAENLKNMYEQMAQYNGMELKDFLEQNMNGMTEEQFEEQVEEAAKNTVKQKLAVKLIAEKEKLNLSEEEYEEEMEQYARDYGFESVDAIKEAIDEDVLKDDILMTRVKEWLAENCKQVEKKKADTAETDSAEKFAEE